MATSRVRRTVSLTTGLLAGAGLVMVVPATHSGAQSPTPSFAKAFAPGSIGPGSVSTLTFTITNSTGSPVTGLAFTDNLPAGMTVASPARATTSCTGGTVTAASGSGTVSLADGSVAGVSSCTVEVDVTSSTPGTSTNVSGDLTSSAGNSGTATADLVVDTDLPGFTKSFSPATVDLGERSTLTFTIDNAAGTRTLSSLAFSDTLPSGLVVADPSNASTTCAAPNNLTAAPGTNSIAFDTFGGGVTLAAGASCTITVDVKANGSGALGNTSSTLTGIQSPGFTAFDAGKAGAVLTSDRAELHLTKNFTDDPIAPGGIATLTLTITNFSRFGDATEVGFNDTFPAGVTLATPASATSTCGGTLTAADGTDTVSLSGGSVAATSSCSITVAVTASSSGTFVNTTGAVSGTIGGLPVTGNAATESLYVVPAPALSKEFTDDPLAAGGSVTLEFTITDTSTTGSSDISFIDDLTAFLPFPITATLPADGFCGPGSEMSLVSLGTKRQGLSVAGASLAAGASCTFAVTIGIGAGVSGGAYENVTSVVTATVDGATVTGDPASDVLLIVAAPPLRKNFSSEVVAPGGQVDVEFVIINGGDGAGDFDAVGPVSDIAFTDDFAGQGLTLVAPLPTDPCGPGSTLSASAGDTLLTLAGGNLGENESCTFVVTVEAGASAAQGSFTNTTSDLTATVLGIAVSGPGASDAIVVSALTATKSFTDDPVLAGDTVTLDFTFANASPDDVTAIAFTDDLGDMLTGTTFDSVISDSCGGTVTGQGGSTISSTGGAVLAGASCTLSVAVVVPAGAEAASYQNITSVIDATIGTESVQLPPATDVLDVIDVQIGLSKEFVDDPVAPGDVVTLRFTLSSPGNAVTGVAFGDDLASTGLALTIASIPAAPCGGSTAASTATVVDFSGGALGAGATCSFDVTVSVPAGVDAGSYENTTSVVTADGGVAGAAASDTLVVVVPPERIADLRIEKSDDADPVAGGDSLTYTVTVINDGPDDAENVVVTDTLPAGVSNPTTAGCAEDPDGTPGCTLGTITAGSSASYTITVDVDSDTVGTITNTATVSSDTTDPDSGNDTATEDTEVIGGADLSITKVDKKDPVKAKNKLQYDITVTNAGPGAAHDVVVTDSLPAGVTLHKTVGCAEDRIGVPTCSLGTIAAGASTTFNVEVFVDETTLGTITNLATVTSSTPDPDPSNNTATEDTLIVPHTGSASGSSGIDGARATPATGGLPVTGSSGINATMLMALVVLLLGSVLVGTSQRRRLAVVRNR